MHSKISSTFKSFSLPFFTKYSLAYGRIFTANNKAQKSTSLSRQKLNASLFCECGRDFTIHV